MRRIITIILLFESPSHDIFKSSILMCVISHSYLSKVDWLSHAFASLISLFTMIRISIKFICFIKIWRKRINIHLIHNNMHIRPNLNLNILDILGRNINVFLLFSNDLVLLPWFDCWTMTSFWESEYIN